VTKYLKGRNGQNNLSVGAECGKKYRFCKIRDCNHPRKGVEYEDSQQTFFAPMAAPVLKTTAVSAPHRVLRTSGVVPTTKPKLKGADGKPILPKTPKPVPASAPVPESATATAKAAEEAAAKAAEEAAARAAAEEAARAQAEAEARAAEEAAARAAEEEYQRQMEEYNRQMEEYNRQMAALQAEEAARAAAAAAAAAKDDGAPAAKSADSAPAPEKAASKPALGAAGAKLAPKTVKPAAKPALGSAGAKLAPKAAKPAAKPVAKHAPAPVDSATSAEEGEATDGQEAEQAGMSEAELSALDAMRTAMQLEASKPPIWKTTKFYVGAGILVAIIGVCAVLVIQDRAEKEAAKAYETRVNTVLKRAVAINQKGIETLADAQTKNVDIVCSKDDAQCLLNIVVDPFFKNSRGQNVLGGNPEGVAQQACLLLGIASEKYPEIDQMIFKTLTEECNNPTFKPSLFRWLVQRMTISNNKGINKKLKKLARAAAKKDLLKGSETAKWKKKGEVLAAIWEAIGLRVTPKDIPEIIDLLKDDACESQLVTVLANCLDNIVLMIDDPAEKAKVGDRIFEALPKNHRNMMAGTLAHACSQKALAYFKERAQDPKNWKADAAFFGNYYNDDIIPFLQELKSKAAGDAKKEKTIDRCITSVVGQNRPRSIEEADKLLAMVFDKINEDTSDWAQVIEKTDPDGVNFIGKDNPEYEKLMERRKALEQCRSQKMMLINTLSGMHSHEWVVNLLEKYKKDPDTDIASDAARAREKVDENTANDKAMRASYKARDKE